MNVGRATWIWHGSDRPERVSAVLICSSASATLKALFDPATATIIFGMQIDAIVVHLPDLDDSSRKNSAMCVADLALDMENLAHSLRIDPGYNDQIVIDITLPLDRIKRAFGLSGCGLQSCSRGDAGNDQRLRHNK